ncbi:hypothetical protein BDN67DRAFT_983984 [Paxillus ammoniavirescens]|nr:hypothetical protein BDN67DRAFT_983984 [Paxillus ammoniavirescens]
MNIHSSMYVTAPAKQVAAPSGWFSFQPAQEITLSPLLPDQKAAPLSPWRCYASPLPPPSPLTTQSHFPKILGKKSSKVVSQVSDNSDLDPDSQLPPAKLSSYDPDLQCEEDVEIKFHSLQRTKKGLADLPLNVDGDDDLQISGDKEQYNMVDIGEDEHGDCEDDSDGENDSYNNDDDGSNSGDGNSSNEDEDLNGYEDGENDVGVSVGPGDEDEVVIVFFFDKGDDGDNPLPQAPKVTSKIVKACTDKPHDVLKKHHAKNVNPAQKPVEPITSQHAKISLNVEEDTGHRKLRTPRYSKTTKEDINGLLRYAKSEMCPHCTMIYSFIPLKVILEYAARDILAQSLAKWRQEKQALEEGIYCIHKLNMCQVIADEALNFQSILKKMAVAAVDKHYDLYPKPSSVKNDITYFKHAKRTAAALLKESDFLQEGHDNMI